MIRPINKSLTWYLMLGHDRQILYYAERPTYSFPLKEEKRAGKVILKSDRKPLWRNILIEIPMRCLDITKQWIEKRSEAPKIDILIGLLGEDGFLIEEWILKEARVVHVNSGRARTVDLEVIRVQIAYNWAGRRK